MGAELRDILDAPLFRFTCVRNGFRYRIRVERRRSNRWGYVKKVTEFADGTVLRYWLGPFFCNVLKDEAR